MKLKLISLTKAFNGHACIPLTWIIATVVLANVMIFDHLAPAGDGAAGFLFDHFQLTLEPGQRTEAAGPFYYSQQTGAEDIWALPPFYSRDRKSGVEFQANDFLYPLWSDLHYGHERRWQFCQLISASSGLEPDGDHVKRFTLFPLYFQQRAADTNLNYTALLPFYGRLKHRLFRDEMYFILFPGFLETRKRDLVTDNYFFPFVDVHHGDGLEGWQVWPLAGREHKDVTTQTNGFGDVTQVPGHDHSFYLWPLYLRQINGLGTTNVENFRAAFPFFASSRSPQREATSVLWPLFNWMDDRGQKYRSWQGPWPFVVFTHGVDRHTARVWPLFSQSHGEAREGDFDLFSSPSPAQTNATHLSTHENNSYLWPGYTFTRTHADPLALQRARVLYYLYSRLAVKNTGTGKERVRTDMWPWFTWHHEFNGNERLQVLAPLEPLVSDNASLERNWSPLWSLWRAEYNPATGARSQSLLWNLYRREAAPGQESISCLFGLYQYRAHADESTFRLFYLPVPGAHTK